jgi:striatin 1/3/4
VTTVAISAPQNRVYSASLDSTIRVWSLPPNDHGPFSPVGKISHAFQTLVNSSLYIDPSLNIATYVGHTDAIWDFKLSPSNYQSSLLASISADKTTKIWDTESSGNLLKSSFTFEGISSDELRRTMCKFILLL